MSSFYVTVRCRKFPFFKESDLEEFYRAMEDSCRGCNLNTNAYVICFIFKVFGRTEIKLKKWFLFSRKIQLACNKTFFYVKHWSYFQSSFTDYELGQ